MDDLLSFPGGELVAQGLEDLAHGRMTAASLTVSVGAPRLRRIGLVLTEPVENPEHRLYALLQEENPDNAHSRYNALIRQLVSFERAAECVAR